MVEHIIKRNADINQVETIEIPETGKFMQARRKRPPFKIGSDGRPLNIRVGETVWVAQSGYGVIAKCEITDLDPVIWLHSYEDLEAVCERFPMSPTYWDQERGKLKKAMVAGDPLCIQVVRYRRTKLLARGEHFPLELPRGLRNSWITMNDEQKAEYFCKQATSLHDRLDDLDTTDYAAIPASVRQAAGLIWPAQSFLSGHNTSEPLEYDHFVPKSLGGPGIFPQNVVPLTRSENRAKRDRPLKPLATVAMKEGLVARPVWEAWDSDARAGPTFGHQQAVVRNVTAAVRTWPRHKQRQFYLDVLTEVRPDAPEQFRKAGIHTGS